MPEYRNERRDIVVKKRKSKIGLIIFNIIEFILVCLIAVLFYGTTSITSTKVLYIPKGSTSYIISYLNKNGFEMGVVDELILKSMGYVQSGWIDINENKLTRLDFAYKLITSKAALKSITLIPGETSYVFLKKLAAEFNLSEEINVFADDFYIEQVISNYITNAIKHVKEIDGKKVISIVNEVNIEKNKVRVKIFNTGENIAEDHINRIWNRFYKVDESRNRTDGGTGIGLSFVKAIMNNYGNRYGVTNKDDGVEFYFDLDLIV